MTTLPPAPTRPDLSLEEGVLALQDTLLEVLREPFADGAAWKALKGRLSPAQQTLMYARLAHEARQEYARGALGLLSELQGADLLPQDVTRAAAGAAREVRRRQSQEQELLALREQVRDLRREVARLSGVPQVPAEAEQQDWDYAAQVRGSARRESAASVQVTARAMKALIEQRGMVDRQELFGALEAYPAKSAALNHLRHKREVRVEGRTISNLPARAQQAAGPLARP